jgi:hypothetical protein
MPIEDRPYFSNENFLDNNFSYLLICARIFLAAAINNQNSNSADTVALLLCPIAVHLATTKFQRQPEALEPVLLFVLLKARAMAQSRELLPKVKKTQQLKLDPNIAL